MHSFIGIILIFFSISLALGSPIIPTPPPDSTSHSSVSAAGNGTPTQQSSATHSLSYCPSETELHTYHSIRFMQQAHFASDTTHYTHHSISDSARYTHSSRVAEKTRNHSSKNSQTIVARSEATVATVLPHHSQTTQHNHEAGYHHYNETVHHHPITGTGTWLRPTSTFTTHESHATDFNHYSARGLTTIWPSMPPRSTYTWTPGPANPTPTATPYWECDDPSSPQICSYIGSGIAPTKDILLVLVGALVAMVGGVALL